MRDDLKALMDRIEEIHREVYTEILNYSRQLQEPISFSELADIGFAFDWAHQLLKKLQIASDKLSSAAQGIASEQWHKLPKDKRFPQYVDSDNRYSAKPVLKHSANLPSHSKDPEAYKALLKWLGISKEGIDSELFRVHWVRFAELFTEWQKQGKPLPPGISPDKVHPHYSLTYRRRKGT